MFAMNASETIFSRPVLWLDVCLKDCTVKCFTCLITLFLFSPATQAKATDQVGALCKGERWYHCLCYIFMTLLCKFKFTYSFILDWVTMMQGLLSARRTSVNGTSKLNPGNGLTAMTVLTMTKMFRSLMPKPLMVSNLSSWTFTNNPVDCYATRVEDCCLSPIQ